MKRTTFIVLFLAGLFLGQAQDLLKTQVQVLRVSEYKEAIANNHVQLVDVRTAKEYLAGHINRAVNIDYFENDTFAGAFGKLDMSKPVYIYCRSGKRSKKSSEKLIKMGFEEIYDLEGGYLAWKSKGVK
jgi:rhodanese-related sulfurtransferase